MVEIEKMVGAMIVRYEESLGSSRLGKFACEHRTRDALATA